MRTLIYGMSVSIDGYFEGENGDISWSVPSEELHRHFNEQARLDDLVLCGRKMYDLMASFWPTAGDDPEAEEVIRDYAGIWLHQPKIVFSGTLESVGWNATLERGDAVDVVRRLKLQPGGRISVGGAQLAGSLVRSGLVDEFWLYIHPVVLGGGRPLFPVLPQKLPLRLLETLQFPGGVVLLRYAQAA